MPFDIGVIGAPFDTAVSYRPGMQTTFQSQALQVCKSSGELIALGAMPLRAMHHILPLYLGERHLIS